MPYFVYDAFWPNGWQARQTADVGDLLEAEPENIWLAFQEEKLVGFVGLKSHPEDQMGEFCIIAVSPACHRQGIGRQLMEFGEDHFRRSRLKMIMVETTGDSGHEAARRTYESFGFQPWPVARYFKEL